MINTSKLIALGAAALVLAGCEGVRPTTNDPNVPRAIPFDRGRDAGPLSAMEAGIYIDPDGCHVWMIDDGLEGYWSRRRDPVSGLPVCTDVAPPNSIVGNVDNSDSGIRDWVPTRR